MLAGYGAVLEIVGFGTLMLASHFKSVGLLYLALTILVSGFAFINPSLNSLLSRRSDPKRQGGILGVGQSLSSLARILGAGIGIPLLMIHPLLPSFAAMILMAIGLVFIVRGDRTGRDYQVSA